MTIQEAIKYSQEHNARMYRTTPRKYYNTIHMIPSESTTFVKEDILADDWEVERKPLVWEGVSFVKSYYPQMRTYDFKDISIDWTGFIGKRVKIRIEDILE